MYIKAVNCLAVSFAVFYRQRDLPWILVPWSWRSRIRALWYNCESNQQYALYRLIYNSKSAVHVSGNVFAYHQEHLTVFTVSVHPSCCWLPAGSNLGEHYQILQIQSSAPDDGRKHRPKHVKPTWNNKLIYIVFLVGYFHSCITMHGFMNVESSKPVQHCEN